MNYEYDYEMIFTPEQIAAIEMGVVENFKVEELIKTKLNERAKLGWEPCFPLQLPSMWFRRVVPNV